MDFKISISSTTPSGDLTFSKNQDIFTSLFLSVSTKKGTFFQDKNFGSEIYKITRITDSNILLFKQYILDATKWLIAIGRAISIDVQVERDISDPTRLNYTIIAKQPNDLIVTWTYFKQVGQSATVISG